MKSPPADGISFASWPIAVATHSIAPSAMSSASGSTGPANEMAVKKMKASETAGAMCVTDWKSTCGRPIESFRSVSAWSGADTAWTSCVVMLHVGCRHPGTYCAFVKYRERNPRLAAARADDGQASWAATARRSRCSARTASSISGRLSKRSCWSESPSAAAKTTRASAGSSPRPSRSSASRTVWM